MLPIPGGRIGAAIVEKYFPCEKWEMEYENSAVSELKAIRDFTGFDFDKVRSLFYAEYLLYRREAWLYGLKQGEQGRELLETLWRLQQTEADTQAIHAFNERGQDR